MRAVFLALGVSVAAMGVTLWAARTALAPALGRLETWRTDAVTAPEGTATAQLFAQAVAGGAIGWDEQAHAPILRRERAAALPQADELLRVGESGTAITAELSRLDALGRIVAIRAQGPACPGPCAERWNAPEWRLSDPVAQGLAGQARIAARLRRDLPAPLPRTHAALADGASDFGPWTTIATERPVAARADLTGIRTLDLLGRLAAVPEGWRIVRRWCRARDGRLDGCAAGQDPAALRLRRLTQNAADSLVIAPLPVPPDAPVTGTYLSDRVRLACTPECRPEWIAAPSRRYVRAQPRIRDGDSPEAAPPVLTLWARIEAGRLVASDRARRLGLVPVTGSDADTPGGLLAAAAMLADELTGAVTLDPDLQALTQEVLAAMLAPSGGPFADLPRRFAENGPQASLVVIDLRDVTRPGAIRATAGVPVPPEGRSAWTLAAAAHDPGGLYAPGAAAWTGRRWHQIPGSAWKMFSALAMIEALDAGLLGQLDAGDLMRVIDGVARPEADRLLGPGALSGAFGLCIPLDLSARPIGARTRDCPEGFHTHPIADSGRAGPLAGDEGATMGLAEALERSSNIWFAAAMLRVESAAQAPVAAHLARRLGLDRPASLDGGRDLPILPRDPALIEAIAPDLSEAERSRAIANGAYGQQVQAGPLILAQLAGSIRLNRAVSPGLIAPLPVAAPLFSGLQATWLLDRVQNGLRAVTAPDGRGTARAVFARRAPELAGRTGGKTGTAERGIGRDRISTFAGWLDAPDGSPAFAIGCAITLEGTPRSGSQGLTVPPLCAHMSAALMQRLDAQVWP
ncbi:hypothetical protein JI664_04455 [Rhodobacter sp. NTK016B]|uniref:hypothetical protein n=1 Tax=Rhodobacter sp. NTK016B TaxID=2759676 RepID=UPI001A8FD05D|nr:hypothetical protein [Rhodobacter sp. NTK016B]MBN8291208.1 hypothetical protein [Rhodobacter sp. NTK016B]